MSVQEPTEVAAEDTFAATFGDVVVIYDPNEPDAWIAADW